MSITFFNWMKYKLHVLYAKSLLQFFRMDKKVVLYWGGKFQASHIVRFTLTLCHQLWTISSIQWKNSQALNSPLTVLVENNIRKPLYLIYVFYICLCWLYEHYECITGPVWRGTRWDMIYTITCINIPLPCLRCFLSPPISCQVSTNV